MADNRLLFWEILLLALIITYPYVRKFFAWNSSWIDRSNIRILLIVVVASSLLHLGYLLEYLQTTEFLFFQFFAILIYFISGFNALATRIISEPIRLNTFNSDLLKLISKGYSGTEPEYINGSYEMIINSPYKFSFNLSCTVDASEKLGYFEVSPYSKNLRNYKIILFIGYYIIFQSLIENNEIIALPILGTEVSGVLFAAFTITLTLFLTWFEFQETQNIAEDLPTLYSKMLKNKALDKLRGGDQLELDMVKRKAKTVLDKKDQAIAKVKENELRNKMENIFGISSDENLDPQTISRVRLMNTVKRILNSTPPWKSVSLENIVELAHGEEDEVELIISGLIDLNEVKGIYDIWSKTYIGTSPSQWFITKLMSDISENSPNLENIRVYPDGGIEFYIENKKEETK